MNIFIAVITLIVLIIGVIFQVKIWKIRALLSPGFYFSLIWILGVGGLLLFKSVDMLIETFPEYIDELNILVCFTSLCFTFLVRKGAKSVNDQSTLKIEFIKSFSLFTMLSCFFLFIAFYVFFIEGSGTDFGSARENMHETVENRSFLVTYFRLLSIPLAIYAGSKIVELLVQGHKISISKCVILMFPFMADSLFSLTEGGRVSMVYSMLMYVVGAVLSLPKDFKVMQYKKVVAVGLVTVLFINIMITWIGDVRDEYHKGEDNEFAEVKKSLGVFSFAYGAAFYIYSTYVGYQYRRVDAVTPELGYGQYTFNGFINWQIPFAGRVGLDNASIAHVLDIYYHNQETYDYEREFYYMTHSAYIPIIKDFGFKGAFFIIFLIVYISHSLFVRIQRYSCIKKSVTFFFYYIFFLYWAKSNFYGTLSSSLLIPLYGFAIIDIINSILIRRQIALKNV